VHLFCSQAFDEIKELGFPSVIVCKDSPWKTRSKTKKGYRAVKTFLHSLFRTEEQTALKKLLRKNGIDLLWFPSPVFEEANVPYIFTVWDLEHRSQPFFPEVGAPQEWRNRENMYENLLPRATYVLTGTTQGKSDIIKYYGVQERRVKVLPMPVPHLPVDLTSKTPLPAGLVKGEYLFYPSQYWPHKNHVALLHLLRVLMETHGIDLKLVFTGSDQGNLSHVRRVTDEMELAHKVSFLGFVEKSMLVNLYRNAFALIFPSFFGPDNLPPLEAFALGCPVIAASVPGSEEQLGDAALLVDQTNEFAMAEAVCRLHTEPELRKRLVKAGARRADAWSADDYVRGVMKLVDDFEPIRRCWDR
jgi:glycosyltransferase involved in cell wall biosynthesis